MSQRDLRLPSLTRWVLLVSGAAAVLCAVFKWQSFGGPLGERLERAISYVRASACDVEPALPVHDSDASKCILNAVRKDRNLESMHVVDANSTVSAAHPPGEWT